MAIDIKASVGRGGRNLPRDVRTIQDLINTNLTLVAPMSPLRVTGELDLPTQSAIELLQSRVLKTGAPDGLISPHGPSMQALTAILGRFPRGDLGGPDWLRVAAAEIGVKEKPGLDENEPRIIEYISSFSYLNHVQYVSKGKRTRFMMGAVDETAWCACFVNWCLKQAGRRAGPSARAKNWLDYGTPTGPQLGAVTIIYHTPFSDSASGWHVGFWIGGPRAAPILLGGNQDNSVCKKQFPGVEKVFCRWPS